MEAVFSRLWLALLHTANPLTLYILGKVTLSSSLLSMLCQLKRHFCIRASHLLWRPCLATWDAISYRTVIAQAEVTSTRHLCRACDVKSLQAYKMQIGRWDVFLSTR